MWSAERYLRFERERARPFDDLVRAIPLDDPRRVVDLGCGPGALTATLVARWRRAFVVGLDTSLEMLTHAVRRAIRSRLAFACADVRWWTPPQPVDVVLSNACFHWIPDHRSLLAHLVGWLTADGVLAFQVPDNFDQPSHRITRDVLAGPPWSGLLPRRLQAAVERPEWYLRELVGHGLEVDVWTTTYLHVLAGPDPVLRWLEGTTLRPALGRLSADHRTRLLDQLRSLLADAYPPESFGTLFPFRRAFVVARRVP